VAEKPTQRTHKKGLTFTTWFENRQNKNIWTAWSSGIVSGWEHLNRGFESAGGVQGGRVRIKKPVVTYDIVSYCRKAACPNLFAALPNIFIV
jgi:hypothetical protein